MKVVVAIDSWVLAEEWRQLPSQGLRENPQLRNTAL